MHIPRLAILIAIGAAAAIGWLFWRQTRTLPLTVSGFVEADEIRVGSQVGGRVAAVLAAEGDFVKNGTPLFTLAPFDWQERLVEAEAQLAAARAEHGRLAAGFRTEEIAQAQAKRDRTTAVLEKLSAGPRPGEIEIARERLNIARANLELAQTEYDRVSRLLKDDRAARTEYDVAMRELKRAQAEVAAGQQEVALLEEGTRAEELAEARAAQAEADQALKLLQAGYRPEEVAKAAAQAVAAEARLAAVKTQMEELTVTSPCDCIVEGVELRPGDLVPPSGPAVTLLDLSRLWVRSYIPESMLGRVRLGQEVPIRIDGYPNRRFLGRVTYIASDGEFTPRNIQTPEERSRQMFRVKLTLLEGGDSPLSGLRVGMAADVLFGEAKGP